MISETTKTITISAQETSRSIMKMIGEKSQEISTLMNQRPSEWRFDDVGNVEITVFEKTEESL